MRPVNIRPLRDGANSIRKIAFGRARIDASPLYQRQGDVWKEPKQALFIDSLINGFDIPKLYFHDVKGLPNIAAGLQYAVVDGKQRLQAVWDFIEDEFPLSDDFVFFEDEEVAGANKHFSELPPKIQARFLDYELPIQIISTDDVQWIEELFCRMNEAVALNAPERRNALGGPLPPLIRELAKHPFFSKQIPFSNNRYKHLDLAVKFLYIEHKDGPAETKRVSLDGFVLEFKRSGSEESARKLVTKVERVLSRMMTIFAIDDDLLNSLGVVVVYYLLERKKVLSGVNDVRETLTQVDGLRRQVRTIMRARSTEADVTSQPKLDSELVEFERLSQSPNDVAAMRKRSEVIQRFVEDPSLIKKKLRELNV